MIPKTSYSVIAPLILSLGVHAADKPDFKAILGKEIIGPRLTEVEWQDYCEARVPRVPPVKSVEEWERLANKIRANVLEQVVYRGEAAAWRDAKLKVEWLDTIEGGPGYKIRKLRYEALPGLWIPALLYIPDKLEGKVPAIMNVNGHDGNGKAAVYKQIRCINLAKRGMLALNLEWLGMGQLRSENYSHGKSNQLDLCGTSGVAPFYLCMKRGLDVLLSHEDADPERVAVTGLSGGGWQTIFISSLDTRVKLACPVAGYSGVRTRIRHFKDLGDSEQTPNDLATVADYDHLTALMAPRPTLLTYNAKDDCCFEAGYALPPLLKAAEPIFKLYGKEKALRSHVNEDPGTHNYEKDNREAFYRMLGDFFHVGKDFDAKEIPSEKEVKTKDKLGVDLPMPNADFHSLAVAVSQKLPREPDLPRDRSAAATWQKKQQARLREIVRAKELRVAATKVKTEQQDGVTVTTWRLKVDNAWTVPVVEFTPATHVGTEIVLHDGGRAASADSVRTHLSFGERVLAVDVFYMGECEVKPRDYLFALVLATIGDRPLGLQASQLGAVARWAREEFKDPVSISAYGRRACLCSLVATALDNKTIRGLKLYGSFASLKQVIEENKSVDQLAEVFCFGLLEAFDIKQLAALVAPRPVEFFDATERHKKELAALKTWYDVWDHDLGDFEPLK